MISQQVYEQTLETLFAPILSFLHDASINEIMINGPGEVIVERRGKLEPTNARFSSREALLSALRNVAQFAGRPLSPQTPILEARLPDGSRLEAVLPPASPDGPHVSIRRFSRRDVTVQDLIESGSLTKCAADLLQALVRAKQNIIVAGGTGSGKTSLLNALSSFIPDGERIIVLEDARELRLQQRHVVQLETCPPDVQGRGGVTIRDLFKATLRMRPDRIVLGEIRGSEALELVQATTSGHGGCMSTVHASHPLDTLRRLETMALMSGVDIPLLALRAQVASGIQVIVQTARLPDGSRCVTHISEVDGLDCTQSYVVRDLYVRAVHAAHGRSPRPSLEPTGVVPRCAEHLRALGYGFNS